MVEYSGLLKPTCVILVWLFSIGVTKYSNKLEYPTLHHFTPVYNVLLLFKIRKLHPPLPFLFLGLRNPIVIQHYSLSRFGYSLVFFTI
jgi:hypothetical protein